jgi:methionyl-tRNA formyltransferase
MLKQVFKDRLKVVFFGTPQFAVPSLVALLGDDRFEVVAVVTQPDKRRGRGNDLVPSPVKVAAGEIPVIQPDRIKKDAAALAQLRSYEADFFVVVAYGQLLSQEILDMPKYGCINGHGSLLPQYRGAAPIQWCLVNGETQTGMTTMLMDIGMDTGAMLQKAMLEIGLLDNAHELADRLSAIAAELILDTLPQLAAGTLSPEPQDNDRATYAALIKKEDYVLDWSQSAIAIHNKVRGFYPGCHTPFRNSTLKVIATVPLISSLPDEYYPLLQQIEPLATLESQTPGTIVAVVKNVGAIVQTGDGYLLLKEVQLAGKKAQSGWDFANGGRVAIGELLG